MISRKISFSSICVVLFAAGCATTMTPEQAERYRQIQEAYAKRIQELAEQRMAQIQARQRATEHRSVSAGGAAPSTPPVLPARPTEQELATRMAALRRSDDAMHHELRRVRDGLEIDGQIYVDPEGELVAAGFDMVTGDVTYLVRDGAAKDRFAVKYMHASTQDPVRIGTLVRQGNGFLFESVTGKRLSGDQVHPASRGLVMVRGVNIFLYRPGERLMRARVPDGYHVAARQRGDIASTHRILIEKDAPKEGSGAELVSLLGAIGNTLGMNRADHYGLLDIETGKIHVFDMHVMGKKVSRGTGCVQRNLLVRECSGSVSYESLYDPTGLRNAGHYYWRLYWFKTPEGIFAIAQESGTSDINMYNLETGERANLFHRGLGIAWFDVLRDRNGMISVTAQMGFRKQRIDDAVAFFNTNKTVQTAGKSDGN